MDWMVGDELGPMGRGQKRVERKGDERDEGGGEDGHSKRLSWSGFGPTTFSQTQLAHAHFELRY